MALINCTECGKEFSDKASACPNCGCPITSMSLTENDDFDFIDLQEQDYSNFESTSSKPYNAIKTDSNIVEKVVYSSLGTIKNSMNIKKFGPMQINEQDHLFRINGAIIGTEKKNGFIKGIAKGMLAFSTVGMSLAAEKIIKNSTKEWYRFEDLLNYDLLEDDSSIISGGVGQALVGGALFGGAGAIAGGITGKRVQRKRVESLYIKITLNSLDTPCLLLPLISVC